MTTSISQLYFRSCRPVVILADAHDIYVVNRVQGCQMSTVDTSSAKIVFKTYIIPINLSNKFYRMFSLNFQKIEISRFFKFSIIFQHFQNPGVPAKINVSSSAKTDIHTKFDFTIISSKLIQQNW